MVLPVVITASEEALKAVPHGFREGSLAVGASKWQTIRKNVLPYALPGILTSSIFGVARVAGETAPIIMFIAAYLMLPEIDGLEVCKILRRDPASVATPILMLTAKAAEVDRTVGLELGADDYVTKPYSPRELVLRIRKLLKRADATSEATEHLRIGSLEIDGPKHEARVKTANRSRSPRRSSTCS